MKHRRTTVLGRVRIAERAVAPNAARTKPSTATLDIVQVITTTVAVIANILKEYRSHVAELVLAIGSTLSSPLLSSLV